MCKQMLSHNKNELRMFVELLTHLQQAHQSSPETTIFFDETFINLNIYYIYIYFFKNKYQ